MDRLLRRSKKGREGWHIGHVLYSHEHTKLDVPSGYAEKGLAAVDRREIGLVEIPFEGEVELWAGRAAGDATVLAQCGRIGFGSSECGGAEHSGEQSALETLSLQHLGFRGFNIPPSDQLLYLREFVPLSPRTRFAAGQREGTPIWDHQLMSEAEMDRDPFYQEFLRRVDLRYFYGGVIDHDGKEMTAVTFHRARKQGHVERSEIALMRRRLPHFRQAYSVTQRLREQRSRIDAFQSALDWLADGVALLAGDGTVLYANHALERIAGRHDGIAISRRSIRLSSAPAAAQLAAALAAVARLRSGDMAAIGVHDFPTVRSSNVPPYLLSVRPVTHGDAGRLAKRTAIALLFVHDPLQQRHRRAARFFREALGLTEAEAHLALALQEGMAVTDYARERAISLNTAYTYLRRIKEKTGCKTLAKLLLYDLLLPLRHEEP